MFTRWLSQDVDATYNKLANVLVKIKEKEVAKTLVERLSKLAPLVTIWQLESTLYDLFSYIADCTLEDVEQSPTTVTRTTSHGNCANFRVGL